LTKELVPTSHIVHGTSSFVKPILALSGIECKLDRLKLAWYNRRY